MQQILTVVLPKNQYPHDKYFFIQCIKGKYAQF